ncbi:ABC transporter substrate-binding protein [Caenispirillum bisanense]|uniref:Osmoprotectant transport system substrate-binding protein n=1 Tax=Caenispirillum bisanense TaxID=414052 RepID=A0A286H1N1_9PROT|nr:ABC transporter substrate-binding protein [Caenispirillum bisanense]SOE01667.1 osmoprotectant transport system substrate-binding protein [Caenispirillum bisanense]
MTRFTRRILGAALGVALGTAAAGSTVAADTLTVASKIDTEGALLGSMMVQALESAGYEVENKVQLGPTNIVRSAILAGEIDLYPEYTGNGAFFTKTADDPVWKDADAGYEKIKQMDLEQNDLVWLPPANANNTWAIAVRGDTARELGLKTMGDFGKWVKEGGQVKLAGSAEFVESAAALPSFQQAYDFTLNQDQLLVLSGGNTAATIRAAAEKTSGTNAAMVYGTDGAIAAADLVVMDDPKGVQMVYEPAPVVRKEVLDADPKIAEVLNPIFAALDRETLQTLNGKIQVDGLPPKQVARDWLESKNLLGKSN